MTITPSERSLRPHHAARQARENSGRRAETHLHRQIRQAMALVAQRQTHRFRRQSHARPTRPTPLPIRQRKRRHLPRHLHRRERLSPRNFRRRHHRQDFRTWAGTVLCAENSPSAKSRKPRQGQSANQNRDRQHRDAPRQHAIHRPQMLCASRRGRRLCRWKFVLYRDQSARASADEAATLAFLMRRSKTSPSSRTRPPSASRSAIG